MNLTQIILLAYGFFFIAMGFAYSTINLVPLSEAYFLLSLPLGIIFFLLFLLIGTYEAEEGE